MISRMSSSRYSQKAGTYVINGCIYIYARGRDNLWFGHQINCPQPSKATVVIQPCAVSTIQGKWLILLPILTTIYSVCKII